MSPVGVEDPDATGAGAKDPTQGIHLHSIRHPRLRRGHIGENLVVAQAAVRRHVEGAYLAVEAYLALRLLLKALLARSADGHV